MHSRDAIFLSYHATDLLVGSFPLPLIRDAIFRKMTNQNQTDTNEMATTETKYQTDFYSAEKIPIFIQVFTRAFTKCRQNAKIIPRNLGQKYQIPI